MGNVFNSEFSLEYSDSFQATDIPVTFGNGAELYCSPWSRLTLDTHWPENHFLLQDQYKYKQLYDSEYIL